MTAQDEASANKKIKEVKASYVVIDYQIAYVDPRTASGKFPAIILWAGNASSTYFDFFLAPQENKQLVPVLLYYPEYYRTFSTRLFSFDGKEVIPQKTIVIAYEERLSQEGMRYKVITAAQEFTAYEGAKAYLESQTTGNATGNYRIIGTDPFDSPVPLEALQHYELVHSSNSTVTLANSVAAPEVKIFKYTD